MNELIKRGKGRPRIFDSPDEFDAAVDRYIELCTMSDPENPTPITLTGMILALGLSSKTSFYLYASREEYHDSVERAKLLIEYEYEKRLVGSTKAAGAIFALKNFGWKDTQTIDINDGENRSSECLDWGDDAGTD